MAKVGIHVQTTKLFKLKPFSAYGTLIDTRKCLEQPSTPFVDMLEGYVTSERMNYRLDKENTFLRVRQSIVEHFNLSYMPFLTVVQQHHLI